MGDPESRKLARQPNAWTGDAWKTLLILMEHRVDLKIYCFNEPPSGLICVTGLDPGSTHLLTAEYGKLDLKTYGLRRFLDSLKIVYTTVTEQFHVITRLFWI